MKSLGFDISTVATGWAVIEDGEPRGSGVIIPVDELKEKYGTKKAARDALRDETYRYAYIVQRMNGILDSIKPHVVTVEDAFLRKNASVLRLLSRLSGGVMDHWMKRQGSPKPEDYVKTTFVPFATEARSFVGFNSGRRSGNELKQAVIDFVNKRFGLDIDNDNEADAMMLALYGYEMKVKDEQFRRDIE